MARRRLARLVALAIAAAATALPARACDVALLFAIDVSGSVNPLEYRLQVDGLAAALRDPIISDALELTQAAVAVMQWSGVSQQELSVLWTRMEAPADIAAFAATVEGMRRAFDGSDTAVGELIHTASRQFDDRVADCRRRVIDISGDGQTNVGRPSGPERNAAHRTGIEINAIAIEMGGRSLAVTEYFRRHVITPGGFVMTARTHADYPDTLRAKIFRELVRPMV